MIWPHLAVAWRGGSCLVPVSMMVPSKVRRSTMVAQSDSGQGILLVGGQMTPG